MPRREGPVEAHLHHPHLLSPADQLLHRLLGGADPRAHDHHDPLGLGGSHVVEEVIGASGDPGEAVHHLLHGVGAGGVERVHRLPRLEEDVGVLGGAPEAGTVRGEGPGAMVPDPVGAHHPLEVLLGEDLDLQDFVGGPEAVEEVEEGDPRLQRCGVGDGGQVHRLLHRAGGHQGEAGRPGGHHVAVVSEDREGLAGHGAGRHVEDRRRQLSRDLVHVGDHQEQALGGGEGGGEGAGGQRSVNGAGGPSFALQLRHHRHRAPGVGAPGGGPGVGELPHVRGGGDGVDGDDLAQGVGHPRRSLVAVNGFQNPGHEFLL